MYSPIKILSQRAKLKSKTIIRKRKNHQLQIIRALTSNPEIVTLHQNLLHNSTPVIKRLILNAQKSSKLQKVNKNYS